MKFKIIVTKDGKLVFEQELASRYAAKKFKLAPVVAKYNDGAHKIEMVASDG